ncbi:MAG: hypothetical protein II529_05205 [Erysipelotrichaceae bacterium]|nr:hypothetical protein [Erysipelotrichaceae bacterium]MBQ2583417.1 hypothetical protein [Erysipelotrichaceae bacterium]
MVIFGLALAYVGLSLVFSLMKTQDEKYKKQVEERRRKDELINALKTYGTGKH